MMKLNIVNFVGPNCKMHSSTTPEKAKKIVFYFVISWIVVNHVASSWLNHNPSLHEDPFLIHERNYKEEHKKIDVLFCGNSMSSLCFQPSLIKKKFPDNTFYNHSILVGGLSVPQLTLNQWTQHNTAPKIIIWTVGLYELNGKPSCTTMRVDRYINITDFPWLMKSGDARYLLLGKMWKNTLSPVSKDYQRWRAHFTGKHTQSLAKLGPDGAIINFFNTQQSTTPEIWKKNKDMYQNFFTDNFTTDNKAVGAMQQFINYCKSNNITLVICCPPSCSNYHQLFNSRDDYNWAFNTLKETAIKNDCDFWDFREWLSDDMFTDGIHMNSKGILTFNKLIISHLNKIIH